MFERSLQDLIRGLRAHKHSSKSELDAFLAEALAEIREELRGKEMDLKADAVMKMVYLMMLYPIPPPPSFAFHVVEVMSSQRYHLKQLGYIAAPLAFSSDTEEVVLTVNGIRKDLLSPHAHLPPLALAGLADIMTPSLAREVHPDVLTLLTHSKPQVRKRAVLVLYRIVEAWPESLAMSFGRLRERLEDDDPGVVSATVNVVVELSRKSDPKNYLPLAPQLFELLTSSSNNWMLIKIVKLFATLTPVEPRLVRKLLPPITNLISTTPAISLLYECVRTCIVGGMLDPSTEAGDALARVCVEKLSGFLGDEDQNLKYIALLAMAKIVPTHPHLISDYQEEILKSLDDADLSIRMRALELATSMADRENVRDIVQQLLSHLVPTASAASSLPSAATALARSADASLPTPAQAGVTPAILSPAYRLEIVKRVIKMTSADTYAHITDFDWYLSVLLDLAYVSNVDVGHDLKDVLLDVVSRVRSVRPTAVALLSRLLSDDNFLDNSAEEGGCVEVLAAAAFICGEHASELRDPRSTLCDLLRPQVLSLHPWILSQYVMAASKIFGHWAASLASEWSQRRLTDLRSTLEEFIDRLECVQGVDDLEVQERASTTLQLLRFIQAEIKSHNAPPDPSADGPDMPNAFADGNVSYPKSLYLISPLFSAYEMNPVSVKAQELVPVPEGLDLNAVLVAPSAYALGQDDDEWEVASDRDDQVDLGSGGGAGMEELRRVIREGEAKDKKSGSKSKKKRNENETEEERKARKAAKRERLARQEGNPYYLDGKKKKKKKDDVDVDSIPIVKLESDDEDVDAPPPKTAKSKAPAEVVRIDEMPEGASTTNGHTSGATTATTKIKKKKKHAIDVDLSSTASSATPASTTARPSASTGRFEEYVVDGEEEEQQPKRSSKVNSTSPPQPPQENAQEETTIAAPEAVSVIKVKRKKKKPVVA